MGRGNCIGRTVKTDLARVQIFRVLAFLAMNSWALSLRPQVSGRLCPGSAAPDIANGLGADMVLIREVRGS